MTNKPKRKRGRAKGSTGGYIPAELRRQYCNLSLAPSTIARLKELVKEGLGTNPGRVVDALVAKA